MASFRQKKITRGQTLSDKLRKTRLEKGLNLQEVEEATKIPIKYIEVLENGQYQKLPGDIYAKAWIRLYAKLLNLPEQELLGDFKIEKSISDKVVKVTRSDDKKNFKYNVSGPKVLKIFLVTIVVIGLLAYLGWEVRNIVAPPEVVILEPANNFKTTDSSVVVLGRTKPEVQLTINNEMVLLDEEGNFSQAVNLITGLNKLEISAKKKHSKTNYLELVILRESLSN